jgi:2-polyprenyl-6-hydroxyphenyl methylase/3-demethylubiquinone-9 3-methyltransferase
MTEPDYAALRDKTRTTWSLGDYSPIERLTLPASRAMIDACAVSAGQEVLDVGAGTGNFALLAAAEGASVVASDLTPKLMERGRERAAADGVELEWVEADAEELPFDDDRFDCTASVFAAMFAPRPERVAREMFRVTRPGNTVGMANWVPDGFSGRMFGLFNDFAPRAEGIPAPVEWGSEDAVRERFDGLAGSLEMERRVVPLAFDSVDAMTTAMETNGPQVAMRQALGPELYDEAMRRFRDLIGEFNQAADGSVRIESEYLLVVARKRG